MPARTGSLLAVRFTPPKIRVKRRKRFLPRWSRRNPLARWVFETKTSIRRRDENDDKDNERDWVAWSAALPGFCLAKAIPRRAFSHMAASKEPEGLDSRFTGLRT